MSNDYIAEFFKKENISYDEIMINKLVQLMKLTLISNEHVNLTAIKDEKEFIEKMILDSSIALKKIEIEKVKNVLDVGSGAGFPGLVLAILYPTINFTCLDSTKKKCAHIDNVCNLLGIKNVQVINARAEDYAKGNIEKFDIVVSRAVASLNILLELCASFAKIDGNVIAMKSLKYDLELKNAKKAISKLGLRLESIQTTILPISNSSRFNIIFKKNKKTPTKFPRSYNEISSKPL